MRINASYAADANVASANLEGCAAKTSLRLFASGLTLAILATAAAPSGADDWRYRDHDIHKFHRHDLDAWRHGHWRHERHNGVFGWWWFGGGLW
jgi:hypothetical protein